MNNRVRQVHRWLSVIFTLAFLINIAVNVHGDQELATVVGLSTVPVILLLMVTGLYMLVHPYAARWRGWSRESVTDVNH